MKTNTERNKILKSSILKKKLTKIGLFTICILISYNVNAQMEKVMMPADSISASTKFKHAINSCPFAPIFGIYSINYEYLLKPNHGLVGRLDYESIPKTYTEADIESSGVAFILNYRYHWSGEMKSWYLGAYSRYRYYEGTGTLESTKFDFDVPELTFGMNIGKRWVWNNGFNINFALGYGFSSINWNSSPTSDSIDLVLKAYEDSYDFFDPFLGELSIGFAF